ncbi:MAG: ABC transporter substrate-binding protein [Gammaproteobacteria bacterium]|jgi:phospholipid transport system substrate-binding protein
MESPTLTKIRWTLHLALLLSLVAVLPQPALAQKLTAPQAVIQKVSDRLQKVLKQNKKSIKSNPGRVYGLVDRVLSPHINFHRVSYLVLGKNWKSASSGQRSRFSAQFKRLLIRTYATAFSEFNNWGVQHLPMRKSSSANDVSVRTKVTRSGANPVSVVYRMHRERGGWKVYDVRIDGISLVTNYRNSFNMEIRRGGMEGLIKRLAAMNRTGGKKKH